MESGALALSVAPPCVSDRDNAALVYQRAFEAMGRESQDDDWVPGAWQWDEAWRKAWEDTWTHWDTTGKIEFDVHDPTLHQFARQAPALKLLRQAAAMPGCCFDRDYGRISISMPLPELQPLRRGGRLLALDAICSAADGNYRQSIADINAMFLMAEHIGGDPLLISELVAIAVDRMAIESLQVIIANFHVPAGELAALRLSDNVSFHVLVQRGLRAGRGHEARHLRRHRIGTNAVLRHNRRRPPTLVPRPAHFVRLPRLPARHRPGGPSPIYGRDGPGGANALLASRGPPAQLDQEVRANPGGTLTATLLPSVGMAMEAAAKADARRDVARLGVAIYACRARNGRFPAKLDDLAPEFIAATPPDPFGGKPMRLRRSDRDLTVYSIGPDLVDNGGTPLGKDNKGDIPFIVPDAAAAKK